MNIRNFCIFPKGSDYISYFQGARYLWLPLELNEDCALEMESPCIVFNMSTQEVEKYGYPEYFFELADERWKDPSLHLPVEAISRAYVFADNAIEWAKAQSERYRQRYDKFLEELLEPNRTGYSRWLHRCLLYGGLLDAYRANQ